MNTFNSLMVAVTNRVLDAYLGVGDRQWGERAWAAYRAQYAAAQARRDSIDAARVAGTRPTHPAAACAGTYVDSLYLDATVRADGDRLVLQLWEIPT